jgi:hypothetical protein
VVVGVGGAEPIHWSTEGIEGTTEEFGPDRDSQAMAGAFDETSGFDTADFSERHHEDFFAAESDDFAADSGFARGGFDDADITDSGGWSGGFDDEANDLGDAAHFFKSVDGIDCSKGRFELRLGGH